jgi:hypothetical protein
MSGKVAAQLKDMIKTEQGIYTSLLCQHASDEGEHLSCSQAFRFLTNLVPLCYVLVQSYHYSPTLTWANHSIPSLSSYGRR